MHGTNETVPSAFTVYLPSFETVRVERLQLLALYGAVAFAGHSFTVDALRFVHADAVSFDRTLITWVAFCSLTDVSFERLGGGGTIGVRVDVAVWPVASVTRYVIGVFVPDVIPATATNVTTPVVVLSVYVPSPEMVRVAPHVFGVTDVFTRHVADVVKAGPPVVASPPVPVNVVNVAVPPGTTTFDSGVATGAGGGVTVGVMVPAVFWFNTSDTTYWIGVAVPVNDGNGSKVTTPVVVFSVYVPWFVTVSVVPVHDAIAVPLAQIPSGTGLRDVPEPAESLEVGVNVWLMSQFPVPVSATAAGGGITVGV